jgi:hypothetical protein
MIFIAAIPIGFQIANQKTRGALNLKVLSHDGPITTYRVNLLSARSIKLYSTFKSRIFGSSCVAFPNLKKEKKLCQSHGIYFPVIMKRTIFSSNVVVA